MILEWLLMTCVTVFLFALYENVSKRRLPPGPIQFALLGTLPQILQSHPNGHIAFQKLAHKYGDVILLKLGACDTVVLSSFEAATDICSSNSVVDRSQTSLIKIRTCGKDIGLFFGGGELWKYSKRFMLRNLRDFGFLKFGSMESAVTGQADELLGRFAEEAKVSGGIVHMDRPFALPSSNVIWGMAAGEIFPQDDETLKNLLHAQDQLSKTGDFGGGISMTFPWIADFFPNWTGKATFTKFDLMLKSYMKDILNSRRQILEDHSKPTCFVDTLVLEIDKNETFADSEFTGTCSCDIDGSVWGWGETSSTILYFSALYILCHPGIQEKMHEEIKRVLEDDEPPTIAQKEK